MLLPLFPNPSLTLQGALLFGLALQDVASAFYWMPLLIVVAPLLALALYAPWYAIQNQKLEAEREEGDEGIGDHI